MHSIRTKCNTPILHPPIRVRHIIYFHFSSHSKMRSSTPKTSLKTIKNLENPKHPMKKKSRERERERESDMEGGKLDLDPSPSNTTTVGTPPKHHHRKNTTQPSSPQEHLPNHRKNSIQPPPPQQSRTHNQIFNLVAWF